MGFYFWENGFQFVLQVLLYVSKLVLTTWLSKEKKTFKTRKTNKNGIVFFPQ
jgi:hypothetical protein